MTNPDRVWWDTNQPPPPIYLPQHLRTQPFPMWKITLLLWGVSTLIRLWAFMITRLS